MCLDIASLAANRSRSLGKNFENVGKVTWLGTKRFLAYKPNEGWSIRDLNFLQRRLRSILGVYQHTHVKIIYARLVAEKNICIEKQSSGEGSDFQNFPWALFEKIEFSWARAYNFQNPNVSDIVQRERELTLKCQKINPEFTCQKKLYVYQQLLQQKKITDKISYKKYKLRNKEALLSKKIFSSKILEYKKNTGTYSYPQNMGDDQHWTANFSSGRLFSNCQKSSLAEDELQALEHPALAHLKAAVDTLGSLKFLKGNEAVLITGACRYGELDVISPCQSNRSLWGENFAAESQEEIKLKLKVFDSPVRSNIFSIAAPTINENILGQFYRMNHLKKLLFRSIAAFSAIKFEFPTKKIIVHTGNWGLSLGHSPKVATLIQIAAAAFSGIDKIEYHPGQKEQEFDQGIKLLEDIKNTNPEMSVKEFLDLLEKSIQLYNLRYEGKEDKKGKDSV